MTLEYDFTNNAGNFNDEIPASPSFGVAFMLDLCDITPPVNDINIDLVRGFSAPFTADDYLIYQFGVGDVDTGDLLFAFVIGSNGGAPEEPTFSGGPYSWTLQATQSGTALGMNVYTAPVLSTPDGTELVHISPTVTDGAFFIWRAKNVDIGAPVVQVLADSIVATAGNPVVIPFAAFGGPTNAGLIISNLSYIYWSVPSPYINYGARLTALGINGGVFSTTLQATFGPGTDSEPVVGLELKHV